MITFNDFLFEKRLFNIFKNTRIEYEKDKASGYDRTVEVKNYMHDTDIGKDFEDLMTYCSDYSETLDLENLNSYRHEKYKNLSLEEMKEKFKKFIDHYDIKINFPVDFDLLHIFYSWGAITDDYYLEQNYFGIYGRPIDKQVLNKFNYKDLDNKEGIQRFFLKFRAYTVGKKFGL